MADFVNNELRPKFIGIVGLNPFAAYISASRLAMFCNHIGQHLVVEDCTVNRLSTGLGREYGKYVHSIKMPCNAIVTKVIHKYPKQIDNNVIGDNPLTAVIYENTDTINREIGVLLIHDRHCLHQHYGFKYVKTPAYYQLMPGKAVPVGTVLATSPTMTPEGDHRFGLEAQVAFMSHPAVAEDGVIVSKSFCQRMKTKGFGTRTVSWGKKSMPVNVFGDDKNFKAFPDIGESVGPNGLLFASRQYDDMLSVAMMSRGAMRELDYFDKPNFAPGAKVTDITVLKGNKDKTFLPVGMDAQCRYYYHRSYHFHEELIKLERELRRSYGGSLQLSPELECLLVEAYAVTQVGDRKHIIPIFNKQPVDEWVVQISFEYDVIPTVGFKLTGMHGDKGVIVEIREDEDMPIDASGNRAELIMDGDSTLKRTNVGRVYEQYINASGRTVSKQLSQMKDNKVSVEDMWGYLTNFYSIISPEMYKQVTSLYTTTPSKMQHLESVIKRGVYLYLPTDNKLSYPFAIKELHENYPACLGPVTYRGNSGNMVTTKSNILIGGMYIMLLEKTGNTWGAVSSAKLQHFGIPAKLNNTDKHSSAGRHNPVRILGEAEVRLITTTCGGETAADMLDQTNNPVVHRVICESFLRSETPTNIDKAVDRDVHPRGDGRILTLVNHVLECGGIRFTGEQQ